MPGSAPRSQSCPSSSSHSSGECQEGPTINGHCLNYAHPCMYVWSYGSVLLHSVVNQQAITPVTMYLRLPCHL